MKRAQLAVKFVDEEQGIIEGWGAPFGGPMNGKDLQGEFFSPKTDFCLDWFAERPILYHHGMDDALKTEVIGRQIETTIKPEGGWIKVQLDKSNRYWEDIKALVKAGRLFFSSGSIPDLVRKTANGELTRWPWIETSMTPSPAHPGAKIAAMKAVEYLEEIGISDEAIKAFELKIQEDGTMAKKDFEKPDGSPAIVKDPSHADPAVSSMNGDKPELAGAEQPVKSNTGFVPPPVKTPEPPAPAPVAPAQPPAAPAPPVILPPEVVAALTALGASITKILSGQQAPSAPATVDQQETAGPVGDKPAVPSEPGVNQGMSPENHISKPEDAPAEQVDNEKPAPPTNTDTGVPKPEEKPEEKKPPFVKNMSSATEVQKEPEPPPSKTQASENTSRKAFLRADLCRKFGTQEGMRKFEEMSASMTTEATPEPAVESAAVKSLREENETLKGEVERLKRLPASDGPVLRAVKTTETGAVPNPRISASIVDTAAEGKKTIQAILDDPSTPQAVKAYLGERSALEEMREMMARGPVPIGNKRIVEKEN